MQVRAVGECSEPETSEPIPYDTEAEHELVCLKPLVLVDENDVSDISVSHDAYGRPVLSVKFKGKGAARLRKATSAMVDERVALLINGEVFALATVREPISSDLALSGRFTEDELQSVVNSLKSQIRAKESVHGGRRVGT